MTMIVVRAAQPYFEIPDRVPRHQDIASKSSRLSQALAWIKRRRQIAADRRHLQAMPDELLRDIGLGRSEIESATEFGRAVPSRR